MNKRLLGGLVSLCLLLAGCSGGEDIETVKGKMGEPVSAAFLTFTVTAAQWDDPADAAAPALPEGKKRIWVWVEVLNGSNAEQPLYYDEFDLRVDGDPRFPEKSFCQQQLPEEQVLAAGSNTSGYLVYLVPEKGKKLELVYDDYYDGDETGKRYVVPVKVV